MLIHTIAISGPLWDITDVEIIILFKLSNDSSLVMYLVGIFNILMHTTGVNSNLVYKYDILKAGILLKISINSCGINALN